MAKLHLQVGPTCRGGKAPQRNRKTLCSVTPVLPLWNNCVQVGSCGQPAHIGGQKAKSGERLLGRKYV